MLEGGFDVGEVEVDGYFAEKGVLLVGGGDGGGDVGVEDEVFFEAGERAFPAGGGDLGPGHGWV